MIPVEIKRAVSAANNKSIDCGCIISLNYIPTEKRWQNFKCFNSSHNWITSRPPFAQANKTHDLLHHVILLNIDVMVCVK